MRAAILTGLCCGIILAQGGCCSSIKGLYPPGADDTAKTVYVVSHGWHTGIAVDRADIPRGVWPENNLFPTARWLEVGWGDEDFYQADDPTLWVTCKAALWPTSSALHVAGFHEPLRSAFPENEIIAVKLSERGFKKLCRYIERSYRRNKQGETIPLNPSLYGDGRFYRANGKFYLPKTCNTWTARALRAAGCPITPVYAMTAGNMMSQTKKFGEVVEQP